MEYKDAVEKYGIDFAEHILQEEYNQFYRGIKHKRYYMNDDSYSIFDDLDDIGYEELY